MLLLQGQVEEEQHDTYKQKLAEDRHTAFKQRLQKLEDKGNESKEIMPAPVVLVLSDKFTAFGGQTSSTAYVVSNLLVGVTVRMITFAHLNYHVLPRSIPFLRSDSIFSIFEKIKLTSFFLLIYTISIDANLKVIQTLKNIQMLRSVVFKVFR